MLFKTNGPLLLPDSFFSSPDNPPAYDFQNNISPEKKVIAILIAFVNIYLVYIHFIVSYPATQEAGEYHSTTAGMSF